MITWILRCEIIDTYLSIINRYLSISIILLRFKPFLAALHSKYEYPLAFSDFIFVQCKNCSNCIFLGFQPRSVGVYYSIGRYFVFLPLCSYS